MGKYLAGDFLIAAEIILIGLAEVAHLAAVSAGWPFARCALLFGVLLCIALLCGICLWYLRRGRFGRLACSMPLPSSAVERGFYALCALLFLSQLVFVCLPDTAYRGGDMTVETVGSFLAEDALYRVNPMTGLPYTEGLPSRLKILCLPTLYGSLCKLTGLSPVAVVRKVVPVVTLVSCYTAFALLAVTLFPREEGTKCREKRACFLTVVSLLLWAGAYQVGMDGFGLLCCGWRGVVIRNLVLLPWLLSLCLRRRWLLAALCIPAEACMVWTLYGCGVCLPFLLGMAGSQWRGRKGRPAASVSGRAR